MTGPPRRSSDRVPAFSLVEVTVAIGLLVFALVSILTLLSVGISNNRRATEDLRASSFLTAIEAELVNSRAGATSALFGFPLPFLTNAAGRTLINTNIQAGVPYSVPLSLSGNTLASADAAPYQAWVIYTRVPPDAFAPVEARVIVNWPAVTSGQVADIARSSGSLETYLSLTVP
jgi:type II secretory pathway pseudopilin PulG